MVSRVSLPANDTRTQCSTRSKIAKLAQLHLQLSASKEQLGVVERQPSESVTKEIDKKVLTAKIADLEAEIAELSRSDKPPPVRCAHDDERERSRACGEDPSPLDAVRLALLKEGHLGTLVNLRA